MQGTIPYLGDLEFLANILLDSNQLTGTLPAWAGNLNNLTNLWLDSNNLTGSIPQVGMSAVFALASTQDFCIDPSAYCCLCSVWARCAKFSAVFGSFAWSGSGCIWCTCWVYVDATPTSTSLKIHTSSWYTSSASQQSPWRSNAWHGRTQLRSSASRGR